MNDCQPLFSQSMFSTSVCEMSCGYQNLKKTIVKHNNLQASPNTNPELSSWYHKTLKLGISDEKFIS